MPWQMPEKTPMDFQAYYQDCRLCPRQCGVNRLAGQTGFCGASAQVEIGLAMLHQWEEPPLSGTYGSGTVFFSHCTLRCVFCQNRRISRREAAGRRVSAQGLAEVFLQLQAQSAHNINLVTAAHYTPHLLEAIPLARDKGLHIPILLNTSGYESVETLRLLDGLIDIYLPDFKYYSTYYARQYSGAADYFDIAHEAITEMLRQIGKQQYDENGLLKRGVIIRHLMLPGLMGDTKQILRHIAEYWGEQVSVSLMRQYTPIDMQAYPEINRRITEEEYAEAAEYFSALGLSGYLQEGEAAQQSFIPQFQ